MAEVTYNTENLLVKDWKTYTGNIKAGTYHRGQLLVNDSGLWEDADDFDGSLQLGVYLGTVETDNIPKTYTSNAWDAIIVFGEIYAGGLVNASGNVLSLTEAQIGILQQSGIFMKKVYNGN